MVYSLEWLSNNPKAVNTACSKAWISAVVGFAGNAWIDSSTAKTCGINVSNFVTICSGIVPVVGRIFSITWAT